MRQNPFSHLAAIEQVEHFYDHQSEVRNVLRLLHQLQNVEVIGPRKIGKTSLLHYISHPVTLRKHDLDPQRYLFVYIDCGHPLAQGERPYLYKMMLERIAEAACRSGVVLAPEPWDDSTAEMAFESVLRRMSSQGLTTVLLLDEFEQMARNQHLDSGFFSNLRALCAVDGITVVYATASCVSLADLCLERRSLLSSPFFNVFRLVRLGLFSEQHSRDLVEDSLRRVDTRFPRELVQVVLEMGGGHPFFLQMAGYHAFGLLGEGEKLTDNKRREFLEAVSKEATGHFECYWQKLDDVERYILAALPLVWQDLSYRETIERLRVQCLIARHDGRDDYFSPLLETFVRRQEVNHLLQVGPLLVDLRRVQVLLHEEELVLSPTNYVLLTCLMQRAGQVVTNEELRRAVWPQERGNAVEQFGVDTVVRLAQEAMLGEIAGREYLVYLRRLLVDRLSDGELRTLCFDLGVDFHDLPGEGRADKVRELVSYLHLRQLIPKMVRVGAETRPDIPWISQSGVTETAPSTSRSPWYERLRGSMRNLCDALGDAADCIVKHGEVGYVFRPSPPSPVRLVHFGANPSAV